MSKVVSKLWGPQSAWDLIPGGVVAAGADMLMGLGREGWEGWDSVVVAELGEQREHRKQLSHRG